MIVLLALVRYRGLSHQPRQNLDDGLIGPMQIQPSEIAKANQRFGRRYSQIEITTSESLGDHIRNNRKDTRIIFSDTSQQTKSRGPGLG